MEKTLLIQLLKSFSSSELRRWKLFTHSDYHCQNKHVRKLAEITFLALKKDKQLQKENVWKLLFPNKPYHELKFNNYTSDLLEQSNHFLIQEAFKKKKGLKFELLQQQLMNKRLMQQAGRVGKKWEKHLQSSSFENLDALEENFRYHYLQDQLTLGQNKRRFGTHLQQKNLEFDRFYLLQQLIHHAEFLNRSNIVKGGYQLARLDGLMKMFNDNEFDAQNIPSIQIYALIVKMLIGENPHENFSNINSLVNENHQCFYAEEFQVIYKYLFNFCVKQINSGNTDYYLKIFNLYQVLINKNLLLQNDSLSQWTYTNIITVGIRLKEWKWTEEFLETYQSYLPLAVQQNAYNYNFAAIHFERHEYKQALVALNELDFQDAFYQMAAKTIQLKIYYLLDEYEAFAALEAASRQFVFRNKQLSDYQQASNTNFIKLLNKFYSYRQNCKRWSTEKCQQRLMQFDETLELPSYNLAHKDWLIMQLKNLKQG